MQDKYRSFRVSTETERELQALVKYWGENASWAIRRAIAEMYFVYVTKKKKQKLLED